MEDFKKDLQQLINKHSLEKYSNTPDFILANYLVECLMAFNYASSTREYWYRKGERDNDVPVGAAPI